MATTDPVSPEQVREILARLALVQERLEQSGVDRAAVEANRFAIAYWRTRLDESQAGPQSAGDR